MIAFNNKKKGEKKLENTKRKSLECEIQFNPIYFLQGYASTQSRVLKNTQIHQPKVKI